MTITITTKSNNDNKSIFKECILIPLSLTLIQGFNVKLERLGADTLCREKQVPLILQTISFEESNLMENPL